jgi:hypothetical protein
MTTVTIGGNGVSWRSVEKLLAYGAGIVAATNGFAQVALPTSLRDWLLGASAVIVAALHVSGPAATANTSTSPPKVVAVPATEVVRSN